MEQLVQTKRQAEELYERHAQALVNFAASVVGTADAEDVVAAVVAKLLQSRPFDRADNKTAYLYRAVLNAARSHLRSQGRRVRRERRVAMEQARVVDWNTPGPDLSVALDAMTPRQRAVVHLTYWEDLTGHEVAKRLGISEGSVRKHLARAKDVVREMANE